MNQHTTSTDITTHLAQIADRLVRFGTGAEVRRLADLARAVDGTAPGAAAALVDRDASEVSRLRAFAVAAAAVLRLPACQQAEVVDAFEQVPVASVRPVAA